MDIRSITNAWSQQISSLPIFAFGLWVTWNLTAFAGLPWYVETADAWRISEFVTFHMIGALLALATLLAGASRSTEIIKGSPCVIVGGILASIGAVFVILSNPDILPSKTIFRIGCIIAGFGTTALFARSAAWLGAMLPRIAFMKICEGVMAGGAGYCTMAIMPYPVNCVAFVLLPVVSALLHLLHSYDAAELRVLEPAGRFDRKYWLFLAALVVYAFAAQLLKSGMFPLSAAEASTEFHASTLMIMAVAIASVFLSAASTEQFGFGRIYRPATLVIIVLSIAIPLTGGFRDAEIGQPIAETLQYVFNLIAWGMAAYITFQAQGGAVRIFCSANAALVLGSLAGSIVSQLLATSGVFGQGFIIACLLVDALASLMAFFVFPERCISEMLIPVDEKQYEKKSDGEDHFAPWKDACAKLAQGAGMTTRETEVFTLLARGKTNQQIADMLVISPYTVRAHTRSVYTKLDVHSRNGLVHAVEATVAENDEPTDKQ